MALRASAALRWHASSPLLFDVVKKHTPNRRNVRQRRARVEQTVAVVRALNVAPGKRNRMPKVERYRDSRPSPTELHFAREREQRAAKQAQRESAAGSS